ncbi:MAG: hypothetical protein HOW73_39365, partial [Polyangiaceae bacterium]|nr:hypothetical protein [Polyangiaceae bacterium]
MMLRTGRPLLLLVFVAALSACPSQSEGERCNAENGNEDCSEGLECKSSRELGRNADICCPPGDSNSESPECIPAGESTGGNGTGGNGTGANGGGGAGGAPSGGGGAGGGT